MVALEDEPSAGPPVIDVCGAVASIENVLDRVVVWAAPSVA